MMESKRKIFSTFRILVGLAVLTGFLNMGTRLSAQTQNPQDATSSGTSAQDTVGSGSNSGAESASSNLVLNATVDSNGSFIRGTGVVSVRRLASPGRYELIFDTDVADGTFVATIGNSGDQLEPSGEISVARRFGNARGVFVQTADSSGNPANRGFHLNVKLNGTSTGNGPEFKTVKVRVHRHSSVALTDADANRILREMGTILQNGDQPGDVPTRVRFELVGSVQVLPSNIAGVIQTSGQLDALFAVGPGVKIVRDIQFCGSPGGSIIGCAPVGSPIVNIAAVRFTTTEEQEGILWAHEYGHNAGLNHRQNDQNAVMFPSIAPSHRVVNSVESPAFEGGPAAATGLVSAITHVEDNDIPRPNDVREFVRQHYAEGVPFRVASTYTAEDADVLLKMLANPKENEEFLPEIVTTLCYIGSEKAVEPLIKFVQSPEASQKSFKAKNAALMHLGDLANRTQSQAAVTFLASVASAPPQARALAAPRVAAAAAERQGAVTPPTEDELAAELAVAATWGLALSGTQKAEAAINGLKANESVAYPTVRQLANEAMKTSRAVRSMGHKEYRMKQSGHGDPK